MSVNVLLSISTTATTLPAGVSAGLFKFQILAADGTTVVAEATDPTSSHTFLTLALDPGDYSIRGERLDSAGASIPAFPPVTGILTVPVQTVSAEIPVSISATLV